jgi:trans-2,3-dihydro-3-hydroxyanthranilate isomerase
MHKRAFFLSAKKQTPAQMNTYAYRLVNVFAESAFGGNPLCVFTDARGMNESEMQGLALQFNLSETTFILPSATATARVRIFTPTFEMAFAGHPTLGSAHVVRDIMNAGDAITLEMKAGIIPVTAHLDRWTFNANPPTSRDCLQTRAELAAILNIDESDVLAGARWINTGSEQLIVPLASVEAVRRTMPKSALLKSIASDVGRSMVYVFADESANGLANGLANAETQKLRSRFFFMKHESVIEDPGTGSATANLGGWMLHHGRAPCRYEITQGEAVSRPCHLTLEVRTSGEIFVSGRVIEIGHGTVSLNS